MSLWPPLLSFPVDSLLSNPDLTKVPKRRFMPPLISSMHFQIYVERNKLSVKKKRIWIYWPIKQLVLMRKD